MDVALGHAELTCDEGWSVSFIVEDANSPNVIARQLRVADALAMDGSTFHHGVLHVISVGSKEETQDVDAKTVVPTGTVVTNKEPVGDGTVCQFPGDAMCDLSRLTCPEFAVTTLCRGAGPQLTRVGIAAHGNLFPEPIFSATGSRSVVAVLRTEPTTAKGADVPSLRTKRSAAMLASSINPAGTGGRLWGCHGGPPMVPTPERLTALPGLFVGSIILETRLSSRVSGSRRSRRRSPFAPARSGSNALGSDSTGR